MVFAQANKKSKHQKYHLLHLNNNNILKNLFRLHDLMYILSVSQLNCSTTHNTFITVLIT